MANKRTIKRNINQICTELFAECVAASLYLQKNNTDNIEAILYSIIKLRSNYIRRVSHPEPGMSIKAYFKDLKSKFKCQVIEISDQINNLN